MSFQAKLKEARKKAGYTQKEVAELLGINHTTYCGYETGKRLPDVHMVKKIAAALNTTGDDLLETGFIRDDPPAFMAIKSIMLDHQEQDLLSLYRQLNPDGKQLALDILRTYASNPALAVTPPAADEKAT